MRLDNRYTDAQIEFVRKRSERMTRKDIAIAFNERYGQSRSETAIKALIANHNLPARSISLPRRSRRILSDEQHDYFTRAYRTLTAKECADSINKWWGTTFTVEQLKTYAANHGIHSGRTGRFEKGQGRPPGSGAKGANSTSFKPIQPHEHRSHKPIGTLRVTADGYIERKVTDSRELHPARRWAQEHRLIWEAEYGPVPKAHALVFLDGDRANLDINNIRCVHRGVLARMNHRCNTQQTSGEARKAAILAAEIEHKAAQLKKETA